MAKASTGTASAVIAKLALIQIRLIMLISKKMNETAQTSHEGQTARLGGGNSGAIAQDTNIG